MCTKGIAMRQSGSYSASSIWGFALFDLSYEVDSDYTGDSSVSAKKQSAGRLIGEKKY